LCNGRRKKPTLHAFARSVFLLHVDCDVAPSGTT